MSDARKATTLAADDSMTLVKLLVRHAKAGPRRPAMRELEKGIWQEHTREAVLGHVRRLALGLHALGLRREEKVAIISDNRPEAFWMLSATQALGAVPVPVYQDAIARQIQFVIDHSDARFVLAEDQEQVDKLFEVRESLPRIERVFYDDPKGLRHYDHEWLMPLAELEKRGRELETAQPGLFDERVSEGRAEDVALISYTSGTTGLPKGAMITHRNLIAAGEGFLAREDVPEEANLVSYLPMAWIGEMIYSLSLSAVRAVTINFPERPDTVLADSREIGNHVFLGPPRIWENSISEIKVKIEDATWLKRWIFRRFVPIGEEVARRRMERRPIPLGLRVLWQLGNALLYAPLRDQRGAGKVRSAFTGGAPLAPEIVLFYRGLGVNLKQVYGQTENTGFCCGQPDDAVKLGTVGLPYPGVELRLTDDGEILTRGQTIFAGYYKNPDATREVVREGWLHSGDAGFFDQDGQLVVVDRLKDVARLADGTTFAPQFIENKLKFSPYIREAVTVGQGQSYVAAMINIDMENVGKWAERSRIPYTTYMDLAQKPEVNALIGQDVERVNRDLPGSTQIRRYVLLHKELDPDDEEITRTRKVRRGFVNQKYAGIIEALFSEGTEVPVTSVITYQDGRQATLETKLALHTVGETMPAAPVSV